MPSGALKRWVLGARHLPQGVYGNDLASAPGTSRPVDRYVHLSGRPVWSGERFLTATSRLSRAAAVGVAYLDSTNARRRVCSTRSPSKSDLAARWLRCVAQIV